MTLEAVLFDLDDTLFEHRRAVERGIRDVLATLDAAPDALDAEVLRWRELEEIHYHRYLSGELAYQDQRRARARAFSEPYGPGLDDAAADDWFAAYTERYRAAFRLHTDALPCLDELERRRPGIRLGIITNGDLVFQTAKLDALGIGTRFDALVTSGALGISKPDPRIFLAACNLIGAAPDRTAYVGDRLRTDAIGAITAGLTGIWLHRADAHPNPADIEEAARLGVPVIGSLSVLADVLLPETAAKRAPGRPESPAERAHHDG